MPNQVSFTRTVSARPGARRYVVSVDGRPIGSIQNTPHGPYDNWQVVTSEARHALDIAYSTMPEALAPLLTANDLDIADVVITMLVRDPK
jgi:hypothetical protein